MLGDNAEDRAVEGQWSEACLVQQARQSSCCCCCCLQWTTGVACTCKLCVHFGVLSKDSFVFFNPSAAPLGCGLHPRIRATPRTTESCLSCKLQLAAAKPELSKLAIRAQSSRTAHELQHHSVGDLVAAQVKADDRERQQRPRRQQQLQQQWQQQGGQAAWSG